MVHVQFKIDNMNMKKYKLGDLLSEFHAGKAIQTENVKNKGAYPVYGGNGQRGYTDSYNQDGEYLIIGRQGAYCGNVRYNIGKAYLTEHAIVGQAKENHNPIYIALKLSLMKLSQLQGQSAQPGLSVNTLSCISMEMPPKEIQDKIADIMLKLDRKIELNKQINDNLEAMAKQLYDYWFVQFDFPNEEGKPYKSSGGAMVYNERLKREIPVGWQVENLVDFAEIKNGATPSTSDDTNYGGDIVWITPKDLSDQQSKFVYQGERNITKQGLDSCSTSMLPINSVLMSSRAPIGLISIAKHEVCTNQGFKSFIPKNMEDSIYLYYYIKHHIKQIEQLGTGTTFKEVSRDDLCKFSILVVGANDAYKQWVELQDEIANKQFVLTKEIASLTKQRDELLPLLMNGQAQP